MADLVQHIGRVAPAALFKACDIVTRDGTDRQRVIWVDGDLLEVECIRAPLGWLEGDGVTRGRPWCEVGERETNLCRRYKHAGEVIDMDHAPTSEADVAKPVWETDAEFRPRILNVARGADRDEALIAGPERLDRIGEKYGLIRFGRSV